MTEVSIRDAKVSDAPSIMRLINELAMRQIMLPRSPASVIEHIRDFVIAEIDGEFAGCGALHIVWSDMSEIRSIAVRPLPVASEGDVLGAVSQLVAKALSGRVG
ncbi:MAG: GNAT family N-acetyltransferase, partial [Planctomycetota bacterium]